MILALIALTTCGKDSPTKPKPPEPPPPPIIPVATRVEIMPSSAALTSIGQTVQLTARVFDQNNNAMSGATLTWSSGNISVAIVNANGLVTAVKNGVGRITARSGSASSTANVIVTQSAGRIVIDPGSATLMSLGDTVQLSATVLDANGQRIEDAVVTWQSGDESVVAVSVEGLVTAVGNGVARITATSGSASEGIDVTMMQSAGRIEIEPQKATLMSIGDTVQLSAAVLDANGQRIEGAVVTWQSGDELVASVSAVGLVTAVGNGVARITATSGSASSGIDVTVQLPVPSPDRDVLVALYTAMDGPNWTINSNWLTERHVDEWYGVNTDEEGRVTALNLGSNRLKGTLTTQLAQLSHLEGLSLEDNQLAGAIPRELGELASLTHLYLFDNQLSGVIPPELGQLTNLIHLCLNSNQLSGVIPPALGQLSNLKWLHLHNNANLMGNLPVELINLELDALLLLGTQVCLTDDPDLEKWLSGIPDARIEVNCEDFDIERLALKAFFHATDGPNWSIRTNWLSDMPIDQWYGIQTDDAGRVIGLTLIGNRLSGTIPSELRQLANLTTLELGGNRLSGEIPEEISQLQKLKELGLAGNLLSGSVPVDLGNIENLAGIYFQANYLTGRIPAELGNLSDLRILWLGNNLLSGSIPAELGNLPNLELLSLNNNNLSGVLPVELGKLTNLISLSLRDNMVSGSIPAELGNLSKLHSLNLRKNHLSGNLPAELGKLENLQVLNVLGNRLTGVIPPGLGQLANLRTLDLGDNSFQTSPLPIELTAIRNLDYLNLQASSLCVPDNAVFHDWLESIETVWWAFDFCNNPERDALVALYHATAGQNWIDNSNWISDRPLQDWFGVSHDATSRVEQLNLESNNLSGVIPDALGNLTGIKSLNFGNNPSLTGTLPNTLRNLPILESLNLEGTRTCAPMDAAFQTWLGSITNLNGVVHCEETADLDERSILTRFFKITNGTEWINDEDWLSDKPLGEWFGVTTDAQGRVTRLELLKNNLAGTIPPELGNLSNLTVLNLYDNQLEGIVPAELGNLTSLTTLILRNNDFNGSIPAELGQLNDLEVLVLNGNELTGDIPAELGRLINLTSLRLIFNSLSGSIPSELGQLTNLKVLSLRGNRLSGRIPPELGQLVHLKELDLSSNRDLSGSIPPELGGLTELSGLWLNHTKLSGSIPVELGNLTNLNSMSLGFSRLTGKMPTELGQLSSLNTLSLAYNGLSGEIPSELVQLTNPSFVKPCTQPVVR